MPTTTTGVATSFIDFTRASNATVTDSDGKVKWAPHNLLTNSESFDAAAWGKTSGIVTITANQTVAPNGSTTADIFNEGTGAGYRLAEQAVSTIASVTYTVGFYAKYVSCQWVSLSLYSNSSATSYGAATFDLLNGVVGTSAAAGTGYAIVGSPVMEPVGSSGWYRCSVTVTNGSSLPANYLAIAASNAGTIGSYGLNSYTGTSRTFSLWGASAYRSDLGGMQPNTSAYPMYNPTTPKNLLGYTEDFSNAAWSKGNILAFGSGSVANAAVAPNGLQTADLLVPDTTSAAHTVFQNSTVGGLNVQALYVKPAGYTKIALRESQTGAYYAAFSLVGAGSVLDSASATAAITALSDGWYRISMIGTISGTTRWSMYFLSPSYTSGSVISSWTPDGTSGIYLWGAQLSDSASLDPYVPVYGAAVTSAAYYGPRRDFDPVTLACKGLLVEEQRTNLQLNSNVFGTSTFAATVVAGAAASPSGLIDASSLACTSVGGRAILSTSVTSGIVYTFSVFIKSGTNTSAYIELAGTAGSGGAVVFNLSSGTVTSGTGGAIVPAPNGFYRCSVTSTATGTGASDMRIGTGDATSKTVFVYGAQLEANASFATSYIPVGSTTAGATRLADVASVSTQAFPYSATEGTMVMNGSVLSTASGNRGAFTLASAGGYISIGNNVSGLGATNADFYTLPAGTFLTASGAVTAGTPFKAAAVYKANDFALSANGAAAVTSSSGALPTSVTDAYIGRIGSSSGYFNGHIRQITYLPRRISNAELVTRST